MTLSMEEQLFATFIGSWACRGTLSYYHVSKNWHIDELEVFCFSEPMSAFKPLNTPLNHSRNLH